MLLVSSLYVIDLILNVGVDTTMCNLQRFRCCSLLVILPFQKQSIILLDIAEFSYIAKLLNVNPNFTKSLLKITQKKKFHH